MVPVATVVAPVDQQPMLQPSSIKLFGVMVDEDVGERFFLLYSEQDIEGCTARVLGGQGTSFLGRIDLGEAPFHYKHFAKNCKLLGDLTCLKEGLLLSLGDVNKRGGSS